MEAYLIFAVFLFVTVIYRCNYEIAEFSVCLDSEFNSLDIFWKTIR